MIGVILFFLPLAILGWWCVFSQNIAKKIEKTLITAQKLKEINAECMDSQYDLHDNIKFVEKYIDLLHIRFPEGFRVDINIEKNLLNKYVLPCAIQLLIENATKHNAVNTENPLTIKVEADEASVRVTNNINPKVGLVESTGLGLKYLRQQYLDICGKNIAIEQTDGTFSVTLPLI